jgi:hypothetical protein
MKKFVPYDLSLGGINTLYILNQQNNSYFGITPLNSNQNKIQIFKILLNPQNNPHFQITHTIYITLSMSIPKKLS